VTVCAVLVRGRRPSDGGSSEVDVQSLKPEVISSSSQGYHVMFCSNSLFFRSESLLVLLLFCVRRPSSKKLIRLHRFKSDRDEIWQDCSSVKYASIDEIGVSCIKLHKRTDVHDRQRSSKVVVVAVGRKRREQLTHACCHACCYSWDTLFWPIITTFELCCRSSDSPHT